MTKKELEAELSALRYKAYLEAPTTSRELEIADVFHCLFCRVEHQEAWMVEHPIVYTQQLLWFVRGWLGERGEEATFRFIDDVEQVQQAVRRP